MEIAVAMIDPKVLAWLMAFQGTVMERKDLKHRPDSMVVHPCVLKWDICHEQGHACTLRPPVVVIKIDQLQ